MADKIKELLKGSGDGREMYVRCQGEMIKLCTMYDHSCTETAVLLRILRESFAGRYPAYPELVKSINIALERVERTRGMSDQWPQVFSHVFGNMGKFRQIAMLEFVRKAVRAEAEKRPPRSLSDRTCKVVDKELGKIATFLGKDRGSKVIGTLVVLAVAVGSGWLAWYAKRRAEEED